MCAHAHTHTKKGSRRKVLEVTDIYGLDGGNGFMAVYCAYFTTHQVTYIKHVQLLTCHLYLNKVVKKKEKYISLTVCFQLLQCFFLGCDRSIHQCRSQIWILFHVILRESDVLFIYVLYSSCAYIIVSHQDSQMCCTIPEAYFRSYKSSKWISQILNKHTFSQMEKKIRIPIEET